MDSLVESGYDAKLAGFYYNVEANVLGIHVTLFGFNDKLPVLAHRVLERIKDIKVELKRLLVIRDYNKRGLTDFLFEQPCQISDYLGFYVLNEKCWTNEEQLSFLNSIPDKDVAPLLQKHIAKIFTNFNIRMVACGNLDNQEAIRIMENAEQILKSNCNPHKQKRTTHKVVHLPHDELFQRALIIPESSNNIWITEVPNAEDPNSSLTYYMQIGDWNHPKSRVISVVLAQILEQPLFDDLRTKEQLGYHVESRIWRLLDRRWGGIVITVQSERGPTYLQSRVDASLDKMLSVLKGMDDKEFKQHIEGLTEECSRKHQTIYEETNAFWNHIRSGYLDFSAEAQSANALKSLTKADVIEVFKLKVLPSSRTRSTLAVHCCSRVPHSKNISAAAAQAFENLVSKSEIAIKEHRKWRENLKYAPAIAEFTEYWANIFDKSNMKAIAAQRLLGEIPSLVQKHPRPNSSDKDFAAEREGVNYIKDVKKFKGKMLSPSEKPMPRKLKQ